MFRKLFWVLIATLCLGLMMPALAEVVINEVLYDTIGTDDFNVMFTELWGTPGTDLTGWTLVGINGNGGTVYNTVNLSGTIPADGYFVIGATSSVPNVDLVVASLDWQNAGSSTLADCDGIDLKDAQGNMIDHLCYGVCASGHLCNGDGGCNAPDPFPSGSINRSVARIPDHAQTHSNCTDWQSTDTPTPGASNNGGAPCNPLVKTLSQIRASNDANGVPALTDSFVVTRGIANVDNFVLDSASLTRFYMQDEDAGINIFRGIMPANIVAGDCLTFSAWVGNYRGLTELVSSGPGNCAYSVTRTAHVNPPAPTLITGNSPFETYEGMLVRINNVTIVSGTWPTTPGTYGDLVVTDSHGQVGLSINRWTNIPGTPSPIQPFSVIGVMTQYVSTPPYTTGYQITPRSLADFVSAAGDAPAAVMAKDFELSGAYPNPFNSTVNIRYEVGSARELTVSIYNVQGREVSRELLRGLTPGTHNYSWTPNGATGVYLVKLSGESGAKITKVLYLR